MWPTFVLLSLAVLAVWLPPLQAFARIKIPLWIPLFLASIAAALWNGILLPTGASALAIFCAVTYGVSTTRCVWWRSALSVACAALALALAMHLVPGFNNPLAVASTATDAGTVSNALYLHYDKGAVGLVLLAWLCRPTSSWAGWLRVCSRCLVWGSATALALLALAWSQDSLKFTAMWPSVAWTFLWANLFLTCLAEEAFFRGWLQDRWARMGKGHPAWVWAAAGMSAALFGAAHLPGGLLLAGLAGLAGLAYAGAYASCRRVEVPLLIHFMVSGAQFVGLTYPRLA